MSSFVGTRKAAAAAESSAAGCLLVSMEWPSPSYRTVIRVPDPRTAFARVMSRFHPTAELKPGVHPTAVVGKDVEMGALVYVGPHAVVGDGTRIGVASSIGRRLRRGKARGAGRGLHPAPQRDGVRQRRYRPGDDSAFRLRSSAPTASAT